MIIARDSENEAYADIRVVVHSPIGANKFEITIIQGDDIVVLDKKQCLALGAKINEIWGEK